MVDLGHQAEAFGALPKTLRERFVDPAPTRSYAHGHSIWYDEQPEASTFTFLVDGCVKLVKTHASGRETIVHLAGPGELLCMSAVVLGQTYCCSAVVVSPTAIVKQVLRREIMSVSFRDAKVATELVQLGADRTITLCRRVDEVSSGRVEQRLARLFERLAARFGEQVADGSHVLPLRLSRRDLADLCATTVETTIRVMRRLEREGVIATTPEGFVVSSMGGLERVCERSSQPPRPKD